MLSSVKAYVLDVAGSDSISMVITKDAYTVGSASVVSTQLGTTQTVTGGGVVTAATVSGLTETVTAAALVNYTVTMTCAAFGVSPQIIAIEYVTSIP